MKCGEYLHFGCNHRDSCARDGSRRDGFRRAVVEIEVTVGIGSTGLVEVFDWIGVVGESRVVDGSGISAMDVEGIEVLSGSVLGVGEPIEEVMLPVGYGYGFVSWEVDIRGVDSTGCDCTGVELGIGGLDEAGPQLKPTL